MQGEIHMTASLSAVKTFCLRSLQRMRARPASRRLRRWEAALMAGLAMSLLAGAWLDTEQSALSGKLLRLHVIANSDTAEDQALKLQVRDRILAEAEALLPRNTSVEEASAILAAALPELSRAGEEAVRAAGYSYPVTASLEEDVWFPTKTYPGFSLPQGRYAALRVVIGEGGGQNWWCVVFPPLCLSSASGTAREAAALGELDEEDVALMTGEDGGYVLKFKAIELWEGLKERAGLGG